MWIKTMFRDDGGYSFYYRREDGEVLSCFTESKSGANICLNAYILIGKDNIGVNPAGQIVQLVKTDGGYSTIVLKTLNVWWTLSFYDRFDVALKFYD